MEERRRRDRQHGAIFELLRRRDEALKIYHPLPEQDRFHASRVQCRLAIGSNRSGKTLCSAVEVARSVTRQDPYAKFPPEGRWIVVGKSWHHIGSVMFPKLFLTQQHFKIIRDVETGRWRTFDPNDQWDWLRRMEMKSAPPLIPRRFYNERRIAWESKKEHHARYVPFYTGWEMWFASGDAEPPQGIDVDGIWLDEEIPRITWLEEMQARVLDRGGVIIWSATPQAGTEQLFDLHEQAGEELNDSDRLVEKFTMLLDDNAFMKDDAKVKFKRNMARRGDAAYRVRVEGEFAIQGFRIFPEFNRAVHVISPFDIPRTWAIYAFIDPGRQVCAVNFLAVPDQADENWAKMRVCVGELYVKSSDARKFAEGMRNWLTDRVCQAFYIDKHEARKHEAGSGKSLELQYSEALKKRGVKSVETGYGFWPCSDDTRSTIESLRGWLTKDEEGDVVYRVFVNCEHTIHQLEHWRYKPDPKTKLPTDQPMRLNNHAVDCARYGAAANPQYRPPRFRSKRPSPVANALEQKRRLRRRVSRGPSMSRRYLNMGPPE